VQVIIPRVTLEAPVEVAVEAVPAEGAAAAAAPVEATKEPD
jgi:hypothetical protein